MSDALRRRTAASQNALTSTDKKSGKESKSQDEGRDATSPEVELPNPLTLRAVAAIFRRRWAAPLTVGVLCLALHLSGFFETSQQDSAPTAVFDIREKLAKPLQFGKYGVGAGALFGSIMWVLVVYLSDDAEGKPQGPAEHWAQNNTVLLAVLLGLGMATGGILAFTSAAILDIVRQGIADVPHSI